MWFIFQATFLFLLPFVLASLTPANLSALQDVISGDGFVGFPVKAIENTVASLRKREFQVNLPNFFYGSTYMISRKSRRIAPFVLSRY
jgi:hypothetical protein